MQVETSLEESNPIQTFAQSRSGNNIYVQKQKGINIYQFADPFSEAQPSFRGDMPIVKLYDTSEPIEHGRELILQENDSRLVFTGRSKGKDEVYYVDAETGKALGQYTHKGALDVGGVGGKGSKDVDFLVVDSQAISRYDPRVKKGKVQEKRYKSKVGFERLATGPGQNFVAGSRSGDIRMFKSVGPSAKNVIPSLLGDPILDLDVSRFGDFILATCEKYILLLPTFQKGASAFEKTFLKTEKPVPRILRVDPRTLVRMGLEGVSFSKAKFDVKEGRAESLVVATGRDCLVIWVLEDVLRNECVSRRVKRLGASVVASQFRRNQDALIAALKNDLVLQPTYGNRKKLGKRNNQER